MTIRSRPLFEEGIKTADSLQLASAMEAGCDVFLTNDMRLKHVSEIRVQLVAEL